MTLDYLEAELDGLRRMDLHRSLRTVEPLEGGRGLVDGREMLLLCTNDYLGLRQDPRLLRAAVAAAEDAGAGAGASRLISGTTPLHLGLEAELAQWMGTEDAVVYATGYMANVGLLTALAGPADLIVMDELNHASLIDGARFSRARVVTVPHASPSEVAKALATEPTRTRRRFVVTDGVFSMDGDAAPFRALIDACEDADATLIVDDAHGLGVLGRAGRGSADAAGCHDDIPVHVGTLSKALGGEGGFVAGPRHLCDWLRNKSRPFIFSTAPAPATIGAALEAVKIAQAADDLRELVAHHARRFRHGIERMGLSSHAGVAPIVPVLLGKTQAARAFSRALEGRGVFTPPIRPPTVPEGTSRVRVSWSAAHAAADVDIALEAVQAAQETLEVAPSAAPS